VPKRSTIALTGAVFGILALVAVWFAAFHVGFVEQADQKIFSGFGGVGHRPRVSSLAWRIASLCNPDPYVFLCAIPVLVALMRRRRLVALTIVGILLGANLTTELLKPLLAHPRADSLLGPGHAPAAASWPSGHATAAMSLALCWVLACPTRLRPAVAALGAVFAVAVSYSFLSLGWHYPTDVVGGFLVASIWTLVGAAGLYRSRASAPATAPRPRSLLGPPAVALGAAGLIAAAMTIARPAQIVTYVIGHRTFVVGAIAIGAAGLALATAVMLALVRAPDQR
jgi:membrane-associated phospholipid phosphatase